MSTLHLAVKARSVPATNRVATLYRAMARELPRVLVIYDIDIPVKEAKAKLKEHFYKNQQIKDDRVKTMLIEKGYMELEETLLQHKQRPHLLRVFEGYVVFEGANRKRLSPESTIEEQFNRD